MLRFTGNQQKNEKQQTRKKQKQTNKQTWQQATQQIVDFESKWYQQAAAIREKHKVSLSFKPCAVYCFFLFCVLFIVLLFVFVFT
jgi:hypothetical protein